MNEKSVFLIRKKMIEIEIMELHLVIQHHYCTICFRFRRIEPRQIRDKSEHITSKAIM